MNNMKIIFGGALMLFALGFGLGKYSQPNKSSESNTTETDSKKETSTTVKEEIRPDGTKIKETTTTSKKETSTKDESIKIVDNAKPDWKVEALAGFNLDTDHPVYGAVVEKRLMGNIFIGVWGTTDKQVGLSASLEF